MKTRNFVVPGAVLSLLMSVSALAQVSPAKHDTQIPQNAVHCVSKKASLSGPKSSIKVSTEEAKCARKMKTLSKEELKEVSSQATRQ